ncbi:hypothetical protein PV04_00644 [Phialophora macrospora]|uniref:Uncharacterized protein n=1 Tax=Phialophora macrospora TaxID=1851006 RepID=A0A0D2FVE5_9EURO|nr:hypothetical protein PV04_00644 [Phialophora macrospora]
MSGITSTKFVDVLSDGLIQALQHLAEVSIVMNPPEDQMAMGECYERSGAPTLFGRPTLSVMKSIDGDQRTRQSRFEVFWRTMLHNYLIDQHPAPGLCGDAVLNDIRDAFYMRMARAMTYKIPSVHSTDAGYVDWEALTRKIGRE